MISPRALSAIIELFQTSVRENVATRSAEPCTIEVCSDYAFVESPDKRRLVVMNISSYDFRIVALFNFHDDAATRAYFLSNSTENKMADGNALNDAFSEFVNMTCGTVNRSLCQVFQHAGMSTPFLLDSNCTEFVPVLKSTEMITLQVSLEEALSFDVHLCIFVPSRSTLDFEIDRQQQMEQVSGELELF